MVPTYPYILDHPNTPKLEFSTDLSPPHLPTLGTFTVSGDTFDCQKWDREGPEQRSQILLNSLTVHTAQTPQQKKSPCSSSLTPAPSELNSWKNRQHSPFQLHHLPIFPRAQRRLFFDHHVAFALPTTFSFTQLFPWFSCHFTANPTSALKPPLNLALQHSFPFLTIKYWGSRWWEWS